MDVTDVHMGQFTEGGNLLLEMAQNRMYSRAFLDHIENRTKVMKTFLV